MTTRSLSERAKADPHSSTLSSILVDKVNGVIHEDSSIAFYDRHSRSFRQQSQADFASRALRVGTALRQAGATDGTPIVVACATPEATLLAFCGAVMVNAIPAIVASRPAFDSRAVVLERVNTARRLMGRDESLLVADVGSFPAELDDAIVIDPKAVEPGFNDFGIVGHSSAGDIAYVQLTSGSTGESKGVAVTHSNLIDNCKIMAARREIDEHDVFMSWLPLYHDMGLVGNALLSLLTGADLYLMSPFDFLTNPGGWLPLVAQKRATVFYSPSSSYELMLDRLDEAELETLDLSHVRYACCGGEPVRASIARRFISQLRSHGLGDNVFSPSYGLAETTLGVSIPSLDDSLKVLSVDRASVGRMGQIEHATVAGDELPTDPDSVNVVAVGRVLDGTSLRLLNADGREISEDLSCGEVVVAGASVSAGLVSSGGIVTSFDDNVVNTGDVGFLYEGELYIVDRIKNVIIRNGENFSTQVIELGAAALLGLSPDDVWVLDADLVNESGLTAIVEVDKRADAASLLAVLLGARDQFEPALESVVLVRKGTLPRTTSGKKRHGAVRELLRSGDLTPLAQDVAKPMADEVTIETSAREATSVNSARSDERAILNFIVEQTRSRGLEVPVVPSSRLKYDLDFDSLAMLDLALAVESLLEIELPQAEVVSVQTVADLLALVAHVRATGTGEQSGVAQTIHRLESSIPQMYVVATQQQQREVTVDGRVIADFASCNYLSLDLHPDVIKAIPPMVDSWGVHPSWTRAVASPEPYRRLEHELAELVGANDTVVFPTVTLLHFGVLPALAGPGGAIIIDSAAHHSMQEAAQLARAKGIRVSTFDHGDVMGLERRLQRMQDRSSRVIVVDGIYSMSGAAANLALYQQLAQRYDATLYIDDAHGFGILGSDPTDEMPYGLGGGGVMRQMNLNYDNIVYVAGMSKAFSSMAAFVTCNSPDQRYRFERASTMIFGGPIPVASLASALAGLEVNRTQGDAIRAELWRLTNKLLTGINELGFEVASTSFPIINVVLGDSEIVVEACNILWRHGILMTPSVFPAMPLDNGGVRFTLTSANTDDEVDRVLEAMTAVRLLVDAAAVEQAPTVVEAPAR